jgi:hypothetical protein
MIVPPLLFSRASGNVARQIIAAVTSRQSAPPRELALAPALEHNSPDRHPT